MQNNPKHLDSLLQKNPSLQDSLIKYHFPLGQRQIEQDQTHTSQKLQDSLVNKYSNINLKGVKFPKLNVENINKKVDKNSNLYGFVLSVADSLSQRLGLSKIHIVDDNGSFASGGVASGASNIAVDGSVQNTMWFDYDKFKDNLTPSQIVAVMAHEAGHMVLHHIPQTMDAEHSIGSSVGWGASIGGALLGKGCLDKLLSNKISNLKIPLFTNKKLAKIIKAPLHLTKATIGIYIGYMAGSFLFEASTGFQKESRKHEYQADEVGARTLGSKNMMIDLFNKFKTTDSWYMKFISPEYISSHPTNENRIKALEKLDIPK